MKQPIKLLLIGAGLEMRNFLTPLMTRNGYAVVEAPGGMSGLIQARNHMPDLILLNVALEDLNSFVVCKQIKADPTLNGIFVVLISEDAVSWEDRSAGLAVGADEYLAMPTTPRDLFSWVQAIVRVQQAEKKLRASEQRFRALVERSSDANALLDSDGLFLYASPSTIRVLGFTSEELIGRDAFEHVHPDDLEIVRAVFKRLRENPGISKSAELRYRHKDGNWRWIEGTGTNWLSDAAVRGIVINYRDITERKRNEQALRTNEELNRRHLAREIHDEIGQGLVALELNLQSVLHAPQTNGVAERVKESIEIVEQLIEQLHGLALDLRPPMLDDLGLIPALRWYANHQSRRACLRVVFDTDSIPTRLDPGTEAACYRVGQEAVTNVVRHARASEMKIQLKLNHDSLHLSVRDDGVGFDLRDQFKSEATSLKLGLLGMKERVSLVGGRIEFKSKPGQGTEVQAWFPKLSAREIKAGDESSSPVGDAASVRVLRGSL